MGTHPIFESDFDCLTEKMSKRKHECIENELNEIVTEWLMKVKCEKSLKLFQSQKAENSNANSNNVLDKVRKFREFLMTKTVEVHKDDDLGFEINFGLQKESNVQKRHLNQKLPKAKESTHKSEKGSKTTVPKSFIRKIKELGMKEEDAEILFKTKIDWSAVYSDNKIYCTEAGCDFVTEIKDNDEDLKSHLRTVHNWGDWPCSDQNCGYIGHSQKNRNSHQQMHTRRSERLFSNKCPVVNCHSSFKHLNNLETHLRYHRNEFDECQYCPYRYIDSKSYRSHLRNHFRIRDFKCDICDLSFIDIGSLNRHNSKHEGITYLCKLCDLKFMANHVTTMQRHLQRKHQDIVGANVNWEAVQKFLVKK